MKRIERNPEKFDALDLFTSLGRTRGYTIGHAASIDEFIKAIAGSLKASQENPIVLHGKRVEAMFAHVAGALGKCTIIKTEDSGDVFIDGENVQVPDYRLTLKAGGQLLVEVKNCHIDSFRKPFGIRTEYFDKLERYAELNSVPLKIAVYFSPLNCWCLLSRRAFVKRGKNLKTTIQNAFAKNEMATLGDLMIATLPELTLELMANPGDAEPIDADGTARITFQTSRLFCAGNELTTPLEQKIAFHFMRYGRWPDRSEAIVQNGKLLGISILAQPEEESPDQPFSVVGQFSSMASAAYSEYTVSDRQLIALDAPIDPDAFSLNIPEDYDSETLPLWRFSMQPNWNFGEGNDYVR